MLTNKKDGTLIIITNKKCKQIDIFSNRISITNPGCFANDNTPLDYYTKDLKSFLRNEKIIEICLVIFSKEIYDYILKNYDCEVIGVIKACNGEYPIYMFNFEGKILGFYLTMIGSTMASQFVIEANWITGASKFIMFGSSGSLNKEISFNKYVIPTEAYRDEGMSYHYAKASDYIEIKNHSTVKNIFDELHLVWEFD